MKKLSILFLFIVFLKPVFGQEETSKKVLFIGNSYTYFWNLPLTVQVMAEKDSIKIKARQSTGGGMSLRQHWNHENNLKTKTIVDGQKFDIIVLQDHSLQAINKPDSLMFYGKLWNEYIRESGAKVYLYSTWARENDPDKQQIITSEYEKLSKEIGATTVPVGLAWEKVRKERPDIQLFDKDGSHPSPTGTYLSALVFYSVLSGKSPIGISPRIITTDKDGEKLYLNIQAENDAKYLQEVAHELVFKS